MNDLATLNTILPDACQAEGITHQYITAIPIEMPIVALRKALKAKGFAIHKIVRHTRMKSLYIAKVGGT